jgi:hypothetical protein
MRKSSFVAGFIFCSAVVCLTFSGAGPVLANPGDVIWIAPARAAQKGAGQRGQGHHPAEHSIGDARQGANHSHAGQKEKSGRPSGSSDGHGGHGSADSRFESEHRALPVRTYQILPKQLLPNARARMLLADGTEKDLDIETCHTNVFSLKMDMDDGPMHGPNNIYIVDQRVKDGVLEVRTAKWLTVHHSCSWGHDYRNDPERLKARPLGDAPLDIVVDNLWDGNFHNGLHSGDDLVIHVFSYGKPVAGATVTITSEKGWTNRRKTDAAGTARVQLIRDYYPAKWQLFNRTKLGRLALTAEFSEDGKSSYSGEEFNKTHYLTSFSWKYVPASEDYSSYGYGLLVGSLGFVGSGFTIFQYRLKRRKIRKKVVF